MITIYLNHGYFNFSPSAFNAFSTQLANLLTVLGLYAIKFTGTETSLRPFFLNIFISNGFIRSNDGLDMASYPTTSPPSSASNTPLSFPAYEIPCEDRYA